MARRIPRARLRSAADGSSQEARMRRLPAGWRTARRRGEGVARPAVLPETARILCGHSHRLPRGDLRRGWPHRFQLPRCGQGFPGRFRVVRRPVHAERQGVRPDGEDHLRARYDHLGRYRRGYACRHHCVRPGCHRLARIGRWRPCSDGHPRVRDGAAQHPDRRMGLHTALLLQAGGIHRFFGAVLQEPRFPDARLHRDDR